MSLGKHVGRRDDVGAHAELARGLDGDGGVVAGDHLDPHALRLDQRRWCALKSSRGGSNIGRMPSSDQVSPPSSERATPSAREPLAARSSTVGLSRSATSAGGLRQVDDRLRRALGDHHGLARGIGDRRLGALGHGIERHELRRLERLRARSGPSAPRSPRYRWRRGPRPSRRAPRRGCRSCASFASNRIGSPSVSWFLVSVPVLSEHRMSTPGHLLDRARAGRRSPSPSTARARPSAMVIENTAGIATGIEATSRISTNCRMPSASSTPQSSATTMSR